jgi:hypothetical protein
VRCAAALAAATLLALATSAEAARLLRVRVGVHPGYARVVLETDAPAAHTLSATSTPGEVGVRLDAANAARPPRVGERGAPEVALADGPDGTTLVTIRAAEPVRVETQVLAAPPRLVVDLRPTGGVEEPAVEESPPPPDPTEAAGPIAEAAPAPVAAALPDASPPRVDDDEPLVMPAVEAPLAMAAIDVPAPTVPGAAGPDVQSEPPPAADAGEPPAPPPGAESAVAAAPPPAPVSAPPPPPIAPARAPELRTIATALAAIAAVLFFAAALRRASPTESVPADPTAEAATPIAVAPTCEPVAEAVAIASPAPSLADVPLSEPPTPEPAPAAAPLEDATMNDFVRMQARMDARLDQVLERLDEIAARLARLEARGGLQEEELRSQRLAIARLQRAVAPAPFRATPREEDATPPRRAS